MHISRSLLGEVRFNWSRRAGAAAVTIAMATGCASTEVDTGVEKVEAKAEALVSLSSCDTPSQSSWPMYGQNILGQRCVSNSGLPTAATAAGLHTKWEVPVPATTSTPIVSNGRVYFGDASTNFYCVQQDTGALVWKVNLFTSGTVTNFDPIRSSAAVSGQYVYVASGHKLWKLDRTTGAIIWSHSMDAHWSVLIDSSPIVVEDKILIGVAGFESVIPIADRTFRGSVVAVDANTGNEIWRTFVTSNDATAGAGVAVWSSTSIDLERRMAFVGTGNTYEAPAAPLADSLLALDLDTGAIIWSHQYVAGDIFVSVPAPGPGPDSDVGATPNLFTLDGLDVVGVGNKSGLYKIFDRATGQVLKSLQLTTAVEVALNDPNIPDDVGHAWAGGIVGSAAEANGIIYVVSNIWFYYDFLNTGVNNPSDTSVMYAIDARTGQILWYTLMSAPSLSGVTKINDVVYTQLVDKHFVGLNAANGSYAFYETLPAPGGSGISAQGDRIYIGYGFSFYGTSAVQNAGVRAYSIN